MGKPQLSAGIGDKDVEVEGHATPGVQALTRGIQLLDIVASAPKGLRFTELLDQTGMPKGTLHRLLQALVDERLLAFDGRDQTYRLAARLFQWAHKVWDDFDLRGAAEPELERLRDLTGEAIRLGVILTMNQPHEFAGDIAMEPGRTEGVFCCQPAWWEDHEVQRIDTSNGAR